MKSYNRVNPCSWAANQPWVPRDLEQCLALAYSFQVTLSSGLDLILHSKTNLIGVWTAFVNENFYSDWSYPFNIPESLKFYFFLVKHFRLNVFLLDLRKSTSASFLQLVHHLSYFFILFDSSDRLHYLRFRWMQNEYASPLGVLFCHWIRCRWQSSC